MVLITVLRTIRENARRLSGFRTRGMLTIPRFSTHDPDDRDTFRGSHSHRHSLAGSLWC